MYFWKILLLGPNEVRLLLQLKLAKFPGVHFRFWLILKQDDDLIKIVRILKTFIGALAQMRRGSNNLPFKALMQHFLQGNVPLRQLLNAKSLFVS